MVGDDILDDRSSDKNQLTTILIIIYYMFKYSVGIKTTLLGSLRSQKNPFKGYISAKLVVRTKNVLKET